MRRRTSWRLGTGAAAIAAAAALFTLAAGLLQPAAAAADARARPAAADDDQFVVFPDDGLNTLLGVIDGAQRTLSVYVFQLDNRDIEAHLVQAFARGVAVRAIIEPQPTGRQDEARAVFARLQAAGLSVKYAGKPFSKTHAKSMVADGSVAWIGSFNYVATWPRTRDYGLLLHDPATVAQLTTTFEDDWAGRRTFAPINPDSHLIVSPTNGRVSFVNLLGGATQSIALEQEQLDDPAIVDLLAARSLAGVRVDVVLDQSQENQKTVVVLRQKAPRLNVALLKQPDIHAKLIIVDGRRMVIGSHNLTKESLDTRREVSVQSDNPTWIARAASIFQSDLTAATSKRAAGAPAAGDLPPSGGQNDTSGTEATTVVGAADQGAPKSREVAGMSLDQLLGTNLFSSAEAIPWAPKLLHLAIAAALAAAIAYRPWRRWMPHLQLPTREVADSQVIIAVAGAVVVTVVGSDLARAFGLVGLGGLVRFRTMVRDTRDAAVMFLMIGIGMAMGLGQVTLAIVFAAFIAAGLAFIDYTDKHHVRRVRLRVDEPRAAMQALREAFPAARIVEAPNTRVATPGASMVVVDLDGAARGMDAAQILDLLNERGITSVRNAVVEEM